jgi:hypothetical protein
MHIIGGLVEPLPSMLWHEERGFGMIFPEEDKDGDFSGWRWQMR